MAITRPEKPASTIANSVILEVEKASIANYQLAATEKQSRVIVVSSLFTHNLENQIQNTL